MGVQDVTLPASTASERLFGYLAIWRFGYLAIWLFGYLAIQMTSLTNQDVTLPASTASERLCAAARAGDLPVIRLLRYVLLCSTYCYVQY